MTFSVEDGKDIRIKDNEDVVIISSKKGSFVCNKSVNDDVINSNGTVSNRQSGTEHLNSNKRGVSIDVTKALVLLGFDSWSSLEPGY